MKKKTSALAIVVAVIFSIFLFPFIFCTGVGSSVVFSLESVVAPDREEELYQSFVDNGGMEWVYDLLIDSMEESMMEGLTDESVEIDLDATEFFPQTQVETIVYDIYHAIIKGKEYQMDLSYQEELLKTKLTDYFEANVEAEVEAEIAAEYGEQYDLLTESQKQEAKETAIKEARNVFLAELDGTVEEEFRALEEEVSAGINSIYDMPEYQKLKDIEAQYGYSLTDRTELCRDIRLAGYILLGLTGVLFVILLLCHLFRPSGFFTAGAFSLLIGGVLFAVAKVAKEILLGLISSEITAEVAAEEFPDFILSMIEDILGWCLTGFEKVGKIGLMAAVIFVLVGILLLVIRKNKTKADSESVMEMQ